MMAILLLVLAAVALAFGIWVGLGMPGVGGGRADRFVETGRARRGLEPNYLHWFKPKRR
jgi:hypothetical protein